MRRAISLTVLALILVVALPTTASAHNVYNCTDSQGNCWIDVFGGNFAYRANFHESPDLVDAWGGGKVNYRSGYGTLYKL